jgi:hypothetical protein
MRQITAPELAAIHARRPQQARHDAGYIVDWVQRHEKFNNRVRVVMSHLCRLHSQNVQITVETLAAMNVPIDLAPMFDAIATMNAYAHTLANYCNLVGVESPDTLLYFIEQGAQIDPAMFVAVAKDNEGAHV